MKNKLKKVYYKFLKIKSRILYGPPVLVTMYHRINDEVGEKLAGLTVSITNFENQLLYYKKKYQILRLEEDWTFLKKTGIVITFDDGYADNIINALPLLEKYNIPATIFVTTLNINTKNEFWWDRLVFDYYAAKDFFFFPGIKEKVSKAKYSYNYCAAIVSKIETNEKENWLIEFESINSINYQSRESFRSLTFDELYRLSEHPLIDIGLHTHNHPALGEMTHQEQRDELQLSLEKLDKVVATSVKYLAVPFGSYNKATLQLSEELGLKGVLLANDYYSNVKNKDSKKINRILMPNINGNELVKRLKNFDV